MGSAAVVAAMLTASPAISAPAPAPRELPATTYATLTSVVTVALSRHARLDVLSSADVRRAVELEGDKRSLGCEENSACLAEIAGAMGARLVVFGQLGDLDGELVLTLNLFDAQSATAAGRVLERAADARELSAKVDGAVDRLVAKTLDGAPPKERLRVMVLDLVPGGTERQGEATGSHEGASAADPELATPWLLYAGAGAAAVGVIVAGTGAIFGVMHQASLDAGNGEPLAAAALKHDQNAQLFGTFANASLVAAAVLVATGGGLAAAHLVLGGAE